MVAPTDAPWQLTALAFDPPLVHQRPKDEAGSDTEDCAFIDFVHGVCDVGGACPCQ